MPLDTTESTTPPPAAMKKSKWVIDPPKRISVHGFLLVGGEKILHAVGEASAWELALTVAADKIAQQAQKVKGKWQDRKRQSRDQSVAPEPASDREPATPAPRVPVRMPRVLRTSRQVVRTLSVAQAARALDGDAERLVVFRDQETDGISVLYRTPGGELMLVVVEG